MAKNDGKTRSAGVLGGRDPILDEPDLELRQIMGLDADGNGPWPAERRALEAAALEEESEA